MSRSAALVLGLAAVLSALVPVTGPAAAGSGPPSTVSTASTAGVPKCC